MVLDRSKAPPIHENIDIQIPATKSFTLDNGLDVYEINLGTQNIIKVELVFRAGRTFESKKLVGRMTASILNEATKTHDSSSLAEEIDFYGASIQSNSNMDHSSLALVCLKKHFSKLLSLLRDIWSEAIFTQEEIDKYKRKVAHQLKINLAKNEILAYRELTSKIFGDHHPYGFNSSRKLYDNVTRDDLLDHYQKNYFNQDTKVFISGLIGDPEMKLVNDILGSVAIKNNKATAAMPTISNEKPLKLKIKAPQEYQTAIRIGKSLFNRLHPDYPVFYLMNTIFGGYFGSRLMKNIREDKAFTYGIHSYTETYNHEGYFSISTEVGNEYLEQTLSEIYYEIDRMKTDLVSEHEFTMARNYLLGQFLNMMDGPMKVSQVMKTMVMNGVDLDYVNKLISRIKETNKKEIREIAVNYLPTDRLWEITAGK